jgi:predicted aminopeptidase
VGTRSVVFHLLIISSFFTLGCSPTYVLRAAFEQSKILLAREPIEEVLESSEISEETRLKLKIARDARVFANQMDLKVGGAFSDYVDVQREVLTWVVVGAKKDSFQLHSWWFPIVGSVPYKGFFDKDDAVKEAGSLERKGFETSVRGAETFSTLGWFDDPLLSTTLARSPVHIANTVIHESVHSTVWIKGSVSFNESLAHFVATEATIQFFRTRPFEYLSEDTKNVLIARTESSAKYQYEFAEMISQLYEELTALYGREDLNTAQKLDQRVAIFRRIVEPFRAKYPTMDSLAVVNNAEIVQYSLYAQDLGMFRELFTLSGSSWRVFFERIAELRLALEDKDDEDPFALLERTVQSLRQESIEAKKN